MRGLASRAQTLARLAVLLAGVYTADVVDTERPYASRGVALILAGGPAGTRGPGARPRSGGRGALREIPRAPPRGGRAPPARTTGQPRPSGATRAGRTGRSS